MEPDRDTVPSKGKWSNPGLDRSGFMVKGWDGQLFSAKSPDPLSSSHPEGFCLKSLVK